MYILLSLILVLSINMQVQSNNQCLELSAVCQSHLNNRTCEECIRTDACCVWAYQKNYTKSRCNIKQNFLMDRNVNVGKIIHAGHSELKFIQDFEFSDPMSGVDEPAVQIRPQKVNVKLRKGEKVSFSLKYKARKNYPLDLYYLVDSTITMKPHVEDMTRLGSEFKKLSELTETFKLGLGYYSDKVVMPYSSLTEVSLANPCYKDEHQKVCDQAFDFMHVLNFTADTSEFINKVKSAKSTANNDNLEGGFDALMQIITCNKELEWRTHSRKIIVLATDAFLHVAGDGILAGITKKHPGTCMLYNGIYDGLQYDYPSIEEIHKQLTKHKIFLLFAIKNDENVKMYYSAMTKSMPEVSDVEYLETETSILKSIKKTYYKLVQNVGFQAIADINHINVTIESNCNNTNNNVYTSYCTNIELEQEYIFNVTIELLDYPSKSKISRSTIRIEETNIKEVLEIDVEYIEMCNGCFNEGHDSVCNNGHYDCGVCDCNEGWHGDICDIQCNSKSGRFVNETYTSPTCFGKGVYNQEDCRCNCDKMYTGQFCENKLCKKNSKQETCSNHGECMHGNCICNEFYSGEICNCPISEDTCQTGNTTCSSHGYCECGKCVCTTKGRRGHFCELCPGCKGFCQNYNEDLISHVTKRPMDNGNKYKFDSVKDIESKKVEDNFTMECTVAYYKDDNNLFCTTKYIYNIFEEIIHIQYEEFCSKPASKALVSMFTIGFIVVAGIIGLLIWKSVIMFKDKREYLKFEKNINMTSFNSNNPLFRSPVTHYRNPLNDDKSN